MTLLTEIIVLKKVTLLMEVTVLTEVNLLTGVTNVTNVTVHCTVATLIQIIFNAKFKMWPTKGNGATTISLECILGGSYSLSAEPGDARGSSAHAVVIQSLSNSIAIR